jgi:hypothetical protein
MKTTRTWVIATAVTASALAAAAIYIVVLQARLDRATRYAHAGMTSVGYVCGVVVNVLRSPDPPKAILRPADACLGQFTSDAELDARRAELDARDYAAVANRIDAQMSDRRLPIGSIKYFSHFSEEDLPKGMRDD